MTCGFGFAAAGPEISEFMASNNSTLATAGGDYPDWIEIHNNSDEAISLSGWHHPLYAPGETDPEPPRATIVHYWNSNQSASLLDPTRTKGDAALALELRDSAAIPAATGQDFFGENARDEDLSGSHLRVNDPLGATLTLALPTRGFDGIVVAYQTRRSAQGAGLQQVEVTTEGMNFSPFASIPVFDAPPVLRMLDFRGFPGPADNPLFGLRITFAQGAGGTDGNNRFDNLTVDGTPIDFTRWRVLASQDLHDWSHVPHGTAVDGPPPEVPDWHSAAVSIPASLTLASPIPDPQMFLRLELTQIPAP